jgi:hypothetical protein
LIVAAVEVRNLGRKRFNPGLLTYLLRGAHDTLYAPTRAGVVGSAGLGQASGLPIGAHAEERLVFRPQAALRRPVLAFQPLPSAAVEVRVPLGD